MKIRINVFKMFLLALYLNTLFIRGRSLFSQQSPAESDEDLEEKNTSLEDDDLDIDNNLFLQNSEHLLSKKNTSSSLKISNINMFAPTNKNTTQFFKRKTNNFIILRKQQNIKRIEKTKEISSRKPVLNKSINMQNNETKYIKSIKNQALEKPKANNVNLTNTKTFTNITSEKREVLKSQFKLEKNKTNLNTATTNDTKKDIAQVNLEKKSFSQLASEFFINFYDQVKGFENSNSSTQKYKWFNQNIMPYLKLFFILFMMFIFVFILHYGIHGIVKKNKLPKNDIKSNNKDTSKNETSKSNKMPLTNHERNNVIKIDENDKKSRKITLKGRVKKVPTTVNYNELFIDSNKNDDKTSYKDKSKDNLEDFLDIVKKKEDYNKMVYESENKRPIEIKEKSYKTSLPKTKQDLLFFDEPEIKYNMNNFTNEIDFNLEFLKNTNTVKEQTNRSVKMQQNINSDEIEDFKCDESVKLINKLKNTGAFKITDLSSPKKKLSS